MQLLLVTARYYPEPFTIVRIAEEFVKMGHSVTVITGRPNYGKWKLYNGYKHIKKETINGVSVIRVHEIPRKKGKLGLIINYLSIFFGFKRGIRKVKGNYDLVFSHVLSPIFAIRGVGSYCRKHHIPHVHYGLDLWPESLIATRYAKRDSWIFNIMKKQSSKIYKTCDYITFGSNCVENYLKEYLGVTGIPFKHIYQPCLTPLPEMKKSKVLQPNDIIQLLYCGTIAQFTRLDILIKAFEDDFVREHFILNVVGSGSAEGEAKALVDSLGLNDNIRFTGRVTPEETLQYFESNDVLYVSLFHNSLTSEMIPQKAIEYLVYSKPIFGMIQGDGAELIKAASSLNVIADQTTEDIISKLKELYTRRDRFAECGKKNRDYFVNNKRFHLDTICEELLSVFEEAITSYRQKDC